MPFSKESRQAAARANKARFQDPEVRQLYSDRMKQLQKTEEFQQARLEGLKKTRESRIKRLQELNSDPKFRQKSNRNLRRVARDPFLAGLSSAERRFYNKMVASRLSKSERREAIERQRTEWNASNPESLSCSNS